ncbi:MAG: hypothetical protein GY696_31100 [Gammaproteobacteria bacterium]|nr:hypothetical protein [Gammaproteobacteria bacterium]
MENTACTTEHTSGEQPREKNYAVLTEAPTQELASWSCEMMKTEWRYQCEPSFQLRLATLPYIRTHRRVQKHDPPLDISATRAGQDYTPADGGVEPFRSQPGWTVAGGPGPVKVP